MATYSELGFPDAAKTGVPDGTNLTAYTGSMTITTPGTVVDGKVISGTLAIRADNVTIKNCQITSGGFWVLDADGGNSGTVVQDCTILGTGTTKGGAGIVGAGQFLRNEVSKVENGVVPGSATTIKGNWIHALLYNGNDPHYDGIQIQGGQNGVLIEDNTILAQDTSDIIIQDYFGHVSNITINHNFLGKDAWLGYNIYVEDRFNYTTTNVSITNNTIDKATYGLYSFVNTNPTVSGNVIWDPNAPPPDDPPPPDPDPDPTPDVIMGTSGNDTLTGTNANESLYGGAGNDTLYGGAGNDRLIGGTGADNLYGGGGSDVFIFTAKTDSLPGFGQRDLHWDMLRGTDKVDVSGIDAKDNVAGDQAFAALTQGTFTGSSLTTPGLLKFHNEQTANGTRTFIEGTTDTASGIDFQLSFVGNFKFTASDFIL